MGTRMGRAAAAILAAGLAAGAVAADGGALPGTAAAAARMSPDPAYLKSGQSRTFRITYTGHVRDVPAGTKRLRVWIPVPQDSAVQTITGLEFSGPGPRLATEKRFGNRLACYEVENPGAALDASYTFSCTRREQVTDLEKLRVDGTESDPVAAEFLKDDRLAAVDDRIRKMAAEATAGKKTTLEKARALYDLVSERMTYDKSGTGWGRGDVNYACEAGRGNCTDFHALFIALCRASDIPAGFEIGLYAPYRRNSDEKLGGYHCWAFFRVPGKTWVPVDISEADRNPTMMQYFFGAHTSNRVTLSLGRDLVLEPRQEGEPVNYLLDPYAEADGKPLPGVSKDWTLQDLE